VKAQTVCKGRGKGFFRENGMQSGIQKVRTPEDVMLAANRMCGKHLITPATPKDGMMVRSVLVTEELRDIKKYFASLQYDKRTSNPVLVYSHQGEYSLTQLLSLMPS
jgi:succinyl-CoA synthetase beta subunit